MRCLQLAKKMASNQSSWRVEDLLDLERCGLAADLASTNLGSGGSDNGWGLGTHLDSQVEVEDITYDMRYAFIVDMTPFIDITPL